MNAIAQLAPSGSIGSWAVFIIIVAAIAAVVYVVLQQMGVAIPPAVVKIFWILCAAVLGILAVGFLLRLGGIV